MRLVLHTVPREQIAYPQLREEIFGRLQPVMGQMQNYASSGMEIVGLPPGHYEMTQMDSKTGRAARTRTVDLANGSVEVGTDGGDETATIGVSLQEEGGGKLPPQTHIMVRGTNRGNSESLGLDEKGDVVFTGLKPDEYHFQVFGGNRAYRIVEVRVDGKPIPAGHLRVSGGHIFVTVVITSSRTHLTDDHRTHRCSYCGVASQ